MKSIIVIPARFKSSRYPGKPLVDIAGKSMIQRTWEQCIKAVDASMVYVATESELIMDHCKGKGMQCVLTTDNCLTGTDRLAEVAEKIHADYYINVQGDEPLINPNDIKLMLEQVSQANGSILNGYCEIDTETDFRSYSVPKVVFRADERMLYMSRAPIPANKSNEFHFGYRQVCIYAYPYQALMAFAAYGKKTHFEEDEDIEVLRFLEMGYEVQCIKMSKESIAVDHPEDVEKVLKRLKDVGAL